MGLLLEMELHQFMLLLRALLRVRGSSLPFVGRGDVGEVG